MDIVHFTVTSDQQGVGQEKLSTLVHLLWNIVLSTYSNTQL